MPCYRPLKGFRSKERNPATGKRSIIFSGKPSECYRDMPITLPCGSCPGCREDHARKWAIRITHEAKLYEHNSFLTLTYNDENLPSDGGLHVEDFQKFFKKLRSRVDRARENGSFDSFFLGVSPRYFHCGEYGDRRGRPHYHACLFGLDFRDKVVAGSRNGVFYYSSKILDETWEKGFCTIGNLEFGSALYVARYTTKKLRGEALEYQFIDEETGEIVNRGKEYATMSRRPGIGARYFEKFKKDFYSGDFVVMNGQKFKVPKYYDQLLERESRELYEKVKAQRKKAPERLSVEEILDAHDRLSVEERFSVLKRAFFSKRSYESA